MPIPMPPIYYAKAIYCNSGPSMGIGIGIYIAGIIGCICIGDIIGISIDYYGLATPLMAIV